MPRCRRARSWKSLDSTSRAQDRRDRVDVVAVNVTHVQDLALSPCGVGLSAVSQPAIRPATSWMRPGVAKTFQRSSGLWQSQQRSTPSTSTARSPDLRAGRVSVVAPILVWLMRKVAPMGP